jgi:hypothetical protein
MSKTILTTSELEQTSIALSAVVNKDNLPFKVSYAFAKLAKEVEKELKILIEIRQKFVKTYAIHNDAGQPIISNDPVTGEQIYTFKDDATKVNYLNELGNLLMMPIEIEHLTIPNKLMEDKDVRLTPIQIKMLMFMIEDDKQEEKK